MIRTAIGLRQSAHRLAFALLTAAMASHGPAHVIAADAETAPKIAGARIGLKNHYKLGFWTPVVVEVAGAAATENLHIDVVAVDSDGVPTTASAPLAPRSSPDGVRSVEVYTLAGRIGSPIQISLADGEQQLDELVLHPASKSKSAATIVPLPATGKLIVSLGSTPYGLSDAFPDRGGSTSHTGRKLIEVGDVGELPNEWYGYESVDVLLIPVGDGKLCQELAGDKVKFAALKRWVENGGRLVILCGGQNAPAMIGENGALTALVPGKLSDVVRLPDSGALEHFASATTPIAKSPIQVPRLVEVEGSIDAYAGRRPIDLPLVVRAARGFGEVTFAGVELSQPPLATWPGRTAFLHALLAPYLAEAATTDASQRLVTSGFNDLSGALRQQLGRSFPSVTPIGFPVVAGLAIAYLLFLGPIDYLFVHRWLRRPLAAWITFPLIVLLFSVLALAIGNRSRGAAGPSINRLELVDFDTITGRARGTGWAALYTPKASRFSPAVRLPASVDPSQESAVLFSWWGLPGAGIGGMQSAGSDLKIIESGYRYGADKSSLEDLPVLASATKSLLVRWDGTAATKIDAQLTDADGLVVGSIGNETGLPLRNARLLYGSWAYRLGNLNVGERIAVGEELSPRRAKTIVTRDALGESGATAVAVEGRVFEANEASAKDILNLMMFYETAGGFGFAHVPNRYQSYCDLSRQLDLGRALLVVEVAGPGAQLVDNGTGEPIGEDGADTSVVVYRFVMPVTRAVAPQSREL